MRAYVRVYVNIIALLDRSHKSMVIFHSSFTILPFALSAIPGINSTVIDIADANAIYIERELHPCVAND